MHVGLTIVLDQDVDVVRDALLNPQVMIAVTEPLLVYRSLSPSGMPRRWTDDAPDGAHARPHPVRADMFGVLPTGATHVTIDRYEVDGVPVQRDSGGGTSGVFARMDMRHRMAATALPDGRTLLRDRLTYRMHPWPLGLALWPGLWLTWQWRAFRMRALAPSWRQGA